MTILRMKGVRVSTLAEFRKNFDFTNAKDYLREGRLSRWFRELGETEIADELDELKDGDCSDQTLLDKFAGLFKIRIAQPAPKSGAPRPSRARKTTGSRAQPATSAPLKEFSVISSFSSPTESPAAASPVAGRNSKTAEQKNASSEYSRKVKNIREKLEDPEFSGKIAAPRETQLVRELLDLLHGYFEKWSAALRKAPGRAMSGNRWELWLTELAEYRPFLRCAELLNRLTSTSRKKKDNDIRLLFELPERMAWTSITRPEQLEKSKVIAAYSVCFVEFEYRLDIRNRKGGGKSAAKPARGSKERQVKKAAVKSAGKRR